MDTSRLNQVNGLMSYPPLLEIKAHNTRSMSMGDALAVSLLVNRWGIGVSQGGYQFGSFTMATF